MTPHEEYWRQIFLDAYKNNTGDARRLALNEAWFAFASSDDYRNLTLSKIQGSAHGHFCYWTALVDAAHVEQEPKIALDGPALDELKAAILEALERLPPEKVVLVDPPFNPFNLGWKPIDTAPRDGTAIMARCVQEGKVAWEAIASWKTIYQGSLFDAATGQRIPEEEIIGWTFTEVDLLTPVPTHWQPLFPRGGGRWPRSNFLSPPTFLSHFPSRPNYGINGSRSSSKQQNVLSAKDCLG